jgi:hypothetical protein
MTACRADRTLRASLIALLLSAGLLAASAAAPAFAQNSGSNLLRPPPVRAEPPPSAAPAPEPAGDAPARATPQLQAPAGIEVEAARPLDPEAIGLIDAARGGFPPDAWAASGRAFAERLVRDLPGPLASQPLRELAWRTLASTAAGPLVATSLAAPGSNAQPNFAGLRAVRLRALGDIESAAELARRIPDRMADPALARLLIDASFLAQTDERACALVREALARGRDVALQKALMFCQALAGDGDRAQLGLAMLRDQGAPEDPAFVTLLLAIGGDGRGVRVDTLRNADPLSLAMLRAAKVAPPADSAQSSDPAVLAALARGNWGTPEFRLAAAERAETFGAMPAGELADFYRAIELTAAQSADPAAFARGDGGPRGRAALFKAADAAPIGPARLTALQALWNHGRERGGYATLARASVALLTQTPPSPDYRFAAADAARALLMAGEREAATGWIRLVRAAQIGGDTAAANEAARIWLLSTLAGIEAGEARSAARLAAWRQALDASDARNAPVRASLGVALLSGLGHLPGGGAAVALPQTAFERQTASLPHPALVTALHEAGIGGRPAECALLVVHMLGGEGAAGAPVYVLLSVLDGLRAVGLEEHARALALESAIASGL